MTPWPRVTYSTSLLGCRRGETLAGVPGPYAQTQRIRLEEWRLRLLQSRLELDLESGHHREAVSELTALTPAHQLHEGFCSLLMLALYRSGRQAEALAVYSDTRHLLAEELGIDPSQEIAGLHQKILEADTALAAPVRGADAEPLIMHRPAQLPLSVADTG